MLSSDRSILSQIVLHIAVRRPSVRSPKISGPSQSQRFRIARRRFSNVLTCGLSKAGLRTIRGRINEQTTLNSQNYDSDAGVWLRFTSKYVEFFFGGRHPAL